MIKSTTQFKHQAQCLQQLLPLTAGRWLPGQRRGAPACLFPNKSHGRALATPRQPSPLVVNTAQFTGINIHVASKSTQNAFRGEHAYMLQCDGVPTSVTLHVMEPLLAHDIWKQT